MLLQKQLKAEEILDFSGIKQAHQLLNEKIISVKRGFKEINISYRADGSISDIRSSQKNNDKGNEAFYCKYDSQGIVSSADSNQFRPSMIKRCNRRRDYINAKNNEKKTKADCEQREGSRHTEPGPFGLTLEKEYGKKGKLVSINRHQNYRANIYRYANGKIREITYSYASGNLHLKHCRFRDDEQSTIGSASIDSFKNRKRCINAKNYILQQDIIEEERRQCVQSNQATVEAQIQNTPREEGKEVPEDSSANSNRRNEKHRTRGN